MIESGSCGTTGATGSLITSTSTCSAAATALDLPDKTAYAVSFGKFSPPGCQLTEQGGTTLYVNTYTSSSASCSSTYKCICSFAR